MLKVQKASQVVLPAPGLCLLRVAFLRVLLWLVSKRVSKEQLIPILTYVSFFIVMGSKRRRWQDSYQAAGRGIIGNTSRCGEVVCRYEPLHS